MKLSNFILIIIYFVSNSLIAFDGKYLDTLLKTWELKNSNSTIVVITNPDSGEIEYVYNEKNAFFKKLPPGSIFKPLSALTMLSLNEKINVAMNEKFNCNGRYLEPKENFFTKSDLKKYNIQINEVDGKKYFKCSIEGGHGEVTMRKALSYSCNAFFLQTAYKHKSNFYTSFVNEWKLNEGTGASFERVVISTRVNLQPSSDFESMLTAIGDEGKIKVTALKMAQIYGSIFASTPILKPILKGESPEQVSAFPYNEQLRSFIQQSLRGVVKEGTLKELALQNSSIQILGGKTGTPTRDGKKFQTHGWNIIYFKKNENSYLLIVFTEKGTGRKEALNVSKTILNSL